MVGRGVSEGEVEKEQKKWPGMEHVEWIIIRSRFFSFFLFNLDTRNDSGDLPHWSTLPLSE